MADTEKEASGQPDSSSGQNQESKDTVQYDTYRKVLSEKKALQNKLAEFEAAQKASEQTKMEEQGKLKELSEALRKENEGLKKSLKDKDYKYGYHVLSNEIKSVAKSLGANDDALEDVVKLGDWTTVEITEDFAVKTDTVKEALLNMQKSKPYLFKSSKPAPNDLPLNSGKPTGSGSFDVKKLKQDDLKKLLAMKLANK